MKNFDISIYGNLIVDTVYETFDFRESFSNKCERKYISPGGTANVVKSLYSIDKHLKISLDCEIGNDPDGACCLKWAYKINSKFENFSPTIKKTPSPTSHALIISDLQKNKRSSIVQWGACSEIKNIDFKKSKWHHIMYVDALPNITEKNLNDLQDNGTISIDFCLGRHSVEEKNRLFKILKFVDYVFISDVEAKSLTETNDLEKACFEISKNTKGSVILHTPKRSVVGFNKGKNISTIKTNFIKDLNLNVLGAGDIYASAFIENMIKTHKCDIHKSVKHSIDYTTSLLQKRK